MYAQQTKTTLEEEIFSVDLDILFLGAWFGYEKHLGNLFTLNSEMGLQGGFRASGDEFVYALAPAFRLEPRYYYHFNKRVKKQRKTIYNSSNFLSLDVSYITDWFLIRNDDRAELITGLYIIPKWGMKRTFGKRINFEFATGLGYVFAENAESGLILEINLRFGFNFSRSK